jgi:hypothetical protein
MREPREIRDPETFLRGKAQVRDGKDQRLPREAEIGLPDPSRLSQ